MAKILIADDEEQILGVMIDVLEGAGHTVVGVGDGSAALKKLETEVFDVALVDVMMPKLNGYQLATKIHGLPTPPRVVIVTSRNFERDADTIEKLGISAFLPKPFSNRDLLEVVARLTQS